MSSFDGFGARLVWMNTLFPATSSKDFTWEYHEDAGMACVGSHARIFLVRTVDGSTLRDGFAAVVAVFTGADVVAVFAGADVVVDAELETGADGAAVVVEAGAEASAAIPHPPTANVAAAATINQ